MSKKRKREPEPARLALASIYDKLADESQEERLLAAHSLLKDFGLKSANIEQTKQIITRLFRGLCSSRKAARLGYSVALTECLVEVNVQRGASIENGLPASSILDILDNETIPEGTNSGQDERDHYFGRLFGAEAVIKSNVLVKQQALVQWKRLLDLICDIANKKPWLKQECGWILYNCIKSFATSDTSVPDDYALDIVEKLTANKLIRTPEGLAIWLEVSANFPDAKLPKHVWKHRDPLSKGDISLLADVMKDAKARDNSDEDEHKSQGKAIWSAQLHFAWDVVLARLYSQAADIASSTRNGTHQKSDHKTINWEKFWSKAVEGKKYLSAGEAQTDLKIESLFAPTSSPERKHWGLLLVSKVLTDAPASLLPSIFRKNGMSCLMNALKGDDRYLQRTAQKTMQSLQKRVEAEPCDGGALLEGLLRATNFADFDTLTKTKAVEKLLSLTDEVGQRELVKTLRNCFQNTGVDDEKAAAIRRKHVLMLQGKLFEQLLTRVKNISQASGVMGTPDTQLSLAILKQWTDVAYFASGESEAGILAETRDLVKSRLSTHLEQLLKLGAPGKLLLHLTIMQIYKRDQRNRDRTVVEFDAAVRNVVNDSWEIYKSLSCSWDVPHTEGSAPSTDGLVLLYCLVMFQVYNGDAEAVEILEDLLGFQQSLVKEANKTKTSFEIADDQFDALIEMLLSFASKQSRFLRRMTNVVFEGIAPQVTSKGLQSLARILAIEENVEGQQEMFDAIDEDADTQDEDDSEASDDEMIDSDVEVVSLSSKASSNADSDNSEEGSEDEELAAFDAKLAAALGTRKLPNGVEDDDDSSTSGASDTDMDDDQMMVLDDKLVAVFHARQQETNKKREKKDAKENIVNFKNRVLDLIDVYLKVEYLASQSLDLLLPLLQVARKTKTRQLAIRACNILNDFCKRCKAANVPAYNDSPKGVKLLLALHTEAGKGASNAHANAASRASILVVKSLVNSGVKVVEVVDVYANTRKKMLTDKDYKVQAGLFTDWNNWCVSAREKFAE